MYRSGCYSILKAIIGALVFGERIKKLFAFAGRPSNSKPRAAQLSSCVILITTISFVSRDNRASCMFLFNTASTYRYAIALLYVLIYTTYQSVYRIYDLIYTLPSIYFVSFVANVHHRGGNLLSTLKS